MPTESRRDTALTLKELAEASGRRVRLHSECRPVSKSEITRQRVAGEKPTVDGILACQWFDCPAELLGVKQAKTADRASYCKWSDYTVYVAFRRKHRDTTCLSRRRSGKELTANGIRWTGCGRVRILELHIKRWNSPMHNFS